jgi:hypothetical protein
LTRRRRQPASGGKGLVPIFFSSVERVFQRASGGENGGVKKEKIFWPLSRPQGAWYFEAHNSHVSNQNDYVVIK